MQHTHLLSLCLRWILQVVCSLQLPRQTRQDGTAVGGVEFEAVQAAAATA